MAPFEWRLASDGVAVVNQLLSPACAGDLRQAVYEVYALLDEMIKVDSVDDADIDSNFRRWGGVWLHPLASFLTRNSPTELAWRHALLQECIAERVRAQFGEEWQPLPKRGAQGAYPVAYGR